MRYIRYKIYDVNGERLYYSSPSWNSTTERSYVEDKIELTKGIYYFVVEKGDAGNYNFRLNFSSSEESFGETGDGTNNSMQTANAISVDTFYKGHLAANDKKDYYKFTIPSSGRIVNEATAYMGYINYYIYDLQGKELYHGWPTWNSIVGSSHVTDVIDLTSGTYYFAVTHRGSVGNYSFNLKYTDAKEDFRETGSGTNNDMAHAESISVNKNYVGQLASNDEKDFYKFTLNSSGTIVNVATAYMYSINYYIYNESGRELYHGWPTWNSVVKYSSVKDEVNLPAGTYYFAVTRGATGVYDFRLQVHTHSYEDVITKATIFEDGKLVRQCSCGEIESTQTIYSPKTIVLSKKNYTYDGKAKRPSVKVKDRKGNIIDSSNYSIDFSGGRKNVGTYKVQVNFKGNYSGNLAKFFTVNPQGTRIQKVTALSKGFKIKVKKQTKQTTGYQIQYSTNRKFTKSTKKLMRSNSVTSESYRKLKPGKKYYVRVRTYKTVSGKKYYSSWSSPKTVVTKR